MARVWEASQHSGTELLMLLAIADFADDDGRAYPSISTLATKCRTKPRYALVLIDALSRSGELEVHKHKGPMGRGGRTNLYRIVFEKLARRAPEAVNPGAVVNQGALLHSSSGSSEPGFREVVNQGAPKPSLNHQEPSERVRKAPKPTGKKMIPECEHQAIVDMFHELLPELPRVLLLGKTRKALISEAWRFAFTQPKSDGTPRATTSEEAIDWFRRFFKKVQTIDWMMGRTGAGRRSTFDYLLSDRGRTKVIESQDERPADWTDNYT